MPARRVALLLQTLPRHDACLPAHTRRWHWSDPAPTHVRIPSPPRSRPPLKEPAATFSTGYAPSGNGSPGAQGRAPKRFGIRAPPGHRSPGFQMPRQRLGASKPNQVPPGRVPASSETRSFQTVCPCGREPRGLLDRGDLTRSLLPWLCRDVAYPCRLAPAADRTFASLRNRKTRGSPSLTLAELRYTAPTPIEKLPKGSRTLPGGRSALSLGVGRIHPYRISSLENKSLPGLRGLPPFLVPIHEFFRRLVRLPRSAPRQALSALVRCSAEESSHHPMEPGSNQSNRRTVSQSVAAAFRC